MKLTILLDQNEQAAFLHLFFYNHHMCLSPSYDFLFYTQIVCFLYINGETKVEDGIVGRNACSQTPSLLAACLSPRLARLCLQVLVTG